MRVKTHIVKKATVKDASVAVSGARGLSEMAPQFGHPEVAPVSRFVLMHVGEIDALSGLKILSVVTMTITEAEAHVAAVRRAIEEASR